MRWLWTALGLIATVLGLVGIASQAFAGNQPWDGELSDALIFAKSIPFAISFGILIGALRSGVSEPTTAGDGVRRFNRGTVTGHWIMAAGFLCAIATGSWQYLGGVLEVQAPIPLYLFYRLHYIGGTLMLFAMASFVTYWALSTDRSLRVGNGQWLRNLRGLAHELPSWAGTLVADTVGLNMRLPAPPTGKFTYYEKTLSFPIWVFGLALITVTGLTKAMRYLYPVPGGVLYWASTLHVAAMVLLGLKLLDHMRYTFARWPLMAAMVTGWVSQRYAQLRHPDWYKSVLTPAEASPETHVVGDAPPAMAGGAE